MNKLLGREKLVFAEGDQKLVETRERKKKERCSDTGKTAMRAKIITNSDTSRFHYLSTEKLFHQGVCMRFSRAKWYPSTPPKVGQPSWPAIAAPAVIRYQSFGKSSISPAPTDSFDGEENKDYVRYCLAKQRREMPDSERLRNNRMKLSAVLRPWKPTHILTSCLQNIQGRVLCIKKCFGPVHLRKIDHVGIVSSPTHMELGHATTSLTNTGAPHE